MGALVFGHFGDRLGRKKLLDFLSLLMMGGATFLIGLPARPHAAVGALAPLLLTLLRLGPGLRPRR